MDQGLKNIIIQNTAADREAAVANFLIARGFKGDLS